MSYKLNYRITGRRPLHVSRTPAEPGTGTVGEPSLDMEQVSVEWTHEDGFPSDTTEVSVNLVPLTHALNYLLDKACAFDRKIITQQQALEVLGLLDTIPKNANGIGIITIEAETRKVVHDQLNVRYGTAQSVIMQMLEEKRLVLAKALGIQP